MRKALQLAAASLLLATGAASAQVQFHRDKPAVEDLSWMWQYTQPAPEGNENGLTNDPRFSELLKKHLKSPQSFWGKNKPLSAVAIEFLAVPGSAIADDNRYLSADGCVPHFCPERGLLWADLGATHPLIVFAAIDWIKDNKTTDDSGSAYTMWVFSNRALDAAHLPAALIQSIARWTARPYGKTDVLQNITRVYMVDPDGTPHPASPADVRARNTLPAETATESLERLNTTQKAHP
jgi:hypothetical protein